MEMAKVIIDEYQPKTQRIFGLPQLKWFGNQRLCGCECDYERYGVGHSGGSFERGIGWRTELFQVWLPEQKYSKQLELTFPEVIHTSYGDMELDILKDWSREFELQNIKKCQYTVTQGMEEMIISMYAMKGV